jgi:hypothetical protein
MTNEELIEQLEYDTMFSAQILMHRELLLHEEDNSRIESHSLSMFGS